MTVTLEPRTALTPTTSSSILLSIPDWMTRNGIQRSLENAGHDVHVVGSETLAFAEQGPVLGLIATDEMAPIGSDPAVSLCASREIPVIWLSTNGSWERPLRVYSIQTVGMLVLPFHEAQLLAALTVGLSLRECVGASRVEGGDERSHPISRAQLEAIVAALEARPLTKRQSDMVLMLLDGERVPTMAERLRVEPCSVRAHLHRIYEKLSVHSQAELVRLIRSRATAGAPRGAPAQSEVSTRVSSGG